MICGIASRVIAAAFALAAFASAVVAGLSVGNPPGRILTTALVSMIVCHAVGLAAGMIGERAVHDHVRALAAKGSPPGGFLKQGAEAPQAAPEGAVT